MLQDHGGLEVLKKIKARCPQTEVIIITGYSSIDTAIEAIQAGAFHYVTKPLKMAELKALAARAIEKVYLVKEKETLKKALDSRSRYPEIIGQSHLMQEVFRLIDKVSPLLCNVLIQGESGTGKELVARAIHLQGPRRDRPFMSFNCGGFTEELIANEIFGHEKEAFTGATKKKSDFWRRPIWAPYSWMKLAQCRQACRSSCYVSFKNETFYGSGASILFQWTFALSPPAIRI
jgi:DNA-binding NtrC family response regulator